MAYFIFIFARALVFRLVVKLTNYVDNADFSTGPSEGGRGRSEEELGGYQR
jgi:hypothetical protein